MYFLRPVCFLSILLECSEHPPSSLTEFRIEFWVIGLTVAGTALLRCLGTFPRPLS